ncbi:MAG: hypothetical protein FWD25_02050 [Clostridia bacterium]|nr:hypothetical protein [Clostridia bacterium]
MNAAAKRFKQIGRMAIVIPSIMACTLFLADMAVPQNINAYNRAPIAAHQAVSPAESDVKERNRTYRQVLFLASIVAMLCKLFAPVRRFMKNPTKTKFWGVLLLILGVVLISARFAFGQELAPFAGTVLSAGVMVTALSIVMTCVAKKIQPKTDRPLGLPVG